MHISLCASKICLYENSDEKIGNLEEGDLTIEIANHSQRIFTVMQDNTFSIFNHGCAALNKQSSNLKTMILTYFMSIYQKSGTKGDNLNKTIYL